MKVKVSLDPQPFDRKPSGTIVGVLRKRSLKCWKEVELAELADQNGNKGHTITPAHLVGGLTQEHCGGMQLFVLDFDHDRTFAEIKKKCDDMELEISYAYHTFSSEKNEERFRVVFAFEELIEDVFIISVILKMLYSLLNGCDTSCKNLDRMFFGGKGVIYLDAQARLSLVKLYYALLKSFNIGNHYADKVDSFSKKTKVAMINGHLVMGEMKDKDAVFGENVDSAVLHITGKSIKSPFFIGEALSNSNDFHQGKTCSKKKKKKMLRTNIKEGSTPCRLYNDFREGKRIDHDPRFLLFTNSLYLNGGIKYFLEIMKEFYTEESYEKWKEYPRYYGSYSPHNCSEELCEYFEICENEGSMLRTLKMDRRIFCEPEEYVDIKEAEECLYLNLQEAFYSTDVGMHLIKAQTGLGKTRAYIRLVEENPENRFLIALPTNNLKEEVKRALIESGVPEKSIFMTASVHGNALVPPEIQDKISGAHNRGFHNATGKIIGDYFRENRARLEGKKIVEEECEKIMEGIRRVNDERIVVTTHAYLAQLEGSFLRGYTVIIDEDFLQLQVFNRMHQVSEECLKIVETMGAEGYSRIAHEILLAEEGEFKKAGWGKSAAALTEGELGELGCFGEDDNVNDLADAGSYVRIKDRDTGQEIVKYFCPLHLPEMKYIVLSATFNYGIYKKYFEGKTKVFVYPEKKAKYWGKIRQYSYHSLGRNDLSGKEQVFDFAKELMGKTKPDIISFKMLEEENGRKLNSAGIHFGNGTGVNSLEGKDLAIIGTPFKAEEYYKLIGCYLGADVNQEGAKRMALRRVKYNGKKFLITSYKESMLREIQLYSIESELEQCVGRARLLRHDCSVFVFSCFPCEQAEIHIKDYLHGYKAGEQEGGQKERV